MLADVCVMVAGKGQTYIAELQREALCGLQLRRAQVHVLAGRGEVLLRRRLLLRLVHGRRQGEVQRASGVVRLTHVDGPVAGSVFQPRADFKKHLVAVLADV